MDETTLREVPPRGPVPRDDGPRTRAFASSAECLESWFLALGPMTGSSDRHPACILPIEERLPALRTLAARTKATRAAGLAVPVLDAIEGLGLDLLDRLLLLGLLRDALDARSNGGRRLASLCDAAGAASWTQQQLVRERLDEKGALRRLGFVESDDDLADAERVYRLAPRWKEALLAGKTEAPAETFDLPPTPGGRLRLAFSLGAALLDKVAPDPSERVSVWAFPVPDGPGWDAAARCRWMLRCLAEEFVSTGGPASGDPLAILLREAGAATAPEAALLLLLLCCGEDDPPVAWALLGPALGDLVVSLPDTSAPLVAASLVEVSPSPGSPHLSTCRATREARRAAVPSGLPPPRATRAAGAKESVPDLDLVERIDPRLKLDGVVLPRATRLRLTEALAVPAALASLAGTDWGVAETLLGEPSVALLLYGPPGTGKTLCAEAIAGQLGKTLWRLRTDQLLSKFVGETEKRLAAVFAEARKNGDVVLLDEADSFLTTREQAVRAWEATMTNVLLQEIERFRGVVVLTTNRDAVLDPALERRLAARVSFPLPGPAERQLLWLRHLPPRVPRAEDVDLKAIAARFPLSGSHIRTAALFAVARVAAREGDARVLVQADLEEAAAAQAARGASRRPAVGFGAAPAPTPRLALVAEHRGDARKENP